MGDSDREEGADRTPDRGADGEGRPDPREVGLLGMFLFLLKAAFVAVGVAGVAGYYLAYRALTEPWIVVDGSAETVIGSVTGAAGILALSWPNPFWLLAGIMVVIGCLSAAHPPWGLRVQPVGLAAFSAGFLVVYYTGGAPVDLGRGVYYFLGVMGCTLLRVGELLVYNILDDRGILRVGTPETE